MRKRMPRPTPALVISLIALFVALGGTSYAALKIGTKDIQNNAVTSKKIKDRTIKAKDINKKTVRSLRGKRGPKGDAGPAGAAGPAGPAGPQGAAGASFDTGLPSGKTLRGLYHIEGVAINAGNFLGTSETYSAALPSNPTLHMIPNGDAPPADCPGTVANPQAAPGHLCVYESGNFSNRSFVDLFINADNVAGGKFGFDLIVLSSDVGPYWSLGSWAVTAP